MRETIVFTGRLEHGELARLLPAVDEVIVPSMFPEAFGMVAAEAAACGALPICAAHSGLAEVTGILGERLPPSVRELLTFERGMRAVEDLGYAMNEWLQLDERLRSSAREALARTSEEHFGWESVAETVMSAACGRTTRLDPVPGTVPFAPTVQE